MRYKFIRGIGREDLHSYTCEQIQSYTSHTIHCNTLLYMVIRKYECVHDTLFIHLHYVFTCPTRIGLIPTRIQRPSQSGTHIRARRPCRCKHQFLRLPPQGPGPLLLGQGCRVAARLRGCRWPQLQWKRQWPIAWPIRLLTIGATRIRNRSPGQVNPV